MDVATYYCITITYDNITYLCVFPSIFYIIMEKQKKLFFVRMTVKSFPTGLNPLDFIHTKTVVLLLKNDYTQYTTDF